MLFDLNLLGYTKPSAAHFIGFAAFAPIDIITRRFRRHAYFHIPVTTHAPIRAAGLIKPTTKQTRRSNTGFRLGKTEGVSGANPVDALLGIVVAATGSVDVVAQRRAEFAGIRFGHFIDTLVFPAFLIGGAAQQPLLGATDGGVREKAWISRGGTSWDAFAVYAFEVSGTDGEYPSTEAADLSVV